MKRLLIILVKAVGHTLGWQMIPDADLIKEDPEYLICFSKDLSVITKK